jgi:hydroxyacid-oxoacid transhydrogenase
MATEYRTETIFAWGAPPLKFGVGALDEIGFDLGQMGLSRVLIVTDEGVAATGDLGPCQAAFADPRRGC